MKAIFYTTDFKGEMKKDIVTSVADMGEENDVLNIYPEVRYQEMEGFGGALTDAAGYIYSEMFREQQEELVQMYFGEEAMNYQKVRIHMDSCDFSTHMYEADSDPDDEKLEKFSFAETERYIIPLLNAAEKAAGKKLKIMLSPWSPPAYMKTNGERKHGGSLKEQYCQRWAEYVCRYIEEFRKRGYEVERVSVQNEPKAVQTWDSCVYTPEQEKTFIKDYLVPAMKKHNLSDVEIFIWDHNKERLYERVRDIIDDETEPMITGAAYHWYSGDHFDAIRMVHEKYPSKKLILSESCLEFSKYEKGDELKNAERLAHDMIGNLNAGMCAFYDWNILLDSKGGPNHVGNFCDAPYLFNLEEKTLEERKCLRYYWHFTHFIMPGAVRLGTTKYTDKLDLTVWENPNGVKTATVLNRSEEEIAFNIRISGELITWKAAPRSIMSVVLVND